MNNIDKSKIFRDNIGKTMDFWIFDRSEDSDIGYRGQIKDTDGYWVSVILKDMSLTELHYFNIDKISEIYFHEDGDNVLEVKIKERSRPMEIGGKK